ncbi:MAG: zf-TFIIB domain-containing protein [Proteobacteria bacterium]|nr:zf-TFIIB domain-containing protein [Pseudomonadota bacterium]
MNCPNCPDTGLVMSDRQGVEIDYCPQCRGVWLDRGELDKLIERASPEQTRRNTQSRPDYADSHPNEAQRYPQRGRKSWLSDIFD